MNDASILSNHIKPISRPRTLRNPHDRMNRPVDMVREADVLRIDFPAMPMRWRVVSVSATKQGMTVHVESIITGMRSCIDRDYLYHLMRHGSIRRETPMELIADRVGMES
jgi:hypothetical protein